MSRRRHVGGSIRDRRRLAALVAFVLTVVDMLAIFLFSTQPGAETSALSESVRLSTETFAWNVVGAIQPAGIDASIPESAAIWTPLGIRQLAHVVEYGSLGVLVCTTVSLLPPRSIGLHAACRERRAWLLACMCTAFCAAYALSDELHKHFVPGRHFDGPDLVLDAVGYLAGIAVVLIVRRAVLRGAGRRYGADVL